MDSCRCVHGQVFIAAILPTAAGFLGDRCRNANPWYTGLKKPTWALPVKSVGCLRAIFNVGIGYASYLVYRDGDGFDGLAKVPLILYGTHLALSTSWGPLVAYTENLDFALVGMKLVVLTAVITGHNFYNINKTAGYIFIPYVLWSGITAFVMYNIRKLNKRAVTE